MLKYENVSTAKGIAKPKATAKCMKIAFEWSAWLHAGPQVMPDASGS